MAQNSVIVKNYSNVFEEIEAGGAITPGHMVELNSSGDVVVHNSAGEFALPMFARENEYEGEGIDDAYADGDKCHVWIPGRGDQVYAILADGQAVAKGDLLVSNGDGTLAEYAKEGESSAAGQANIQAIVAVAVEAVDTSGSSAEESSALQGNTHRIIVRIV